jgi:hypothetical protein
MRQLKIDQSKLELAFDSGSEMISYYLDLETGEVISVSDEERGSLESIYESYYDEQSETVNWENASEKEHVPDWQRELLQNADQVEAGFGDRFIAIPSEGSHEGYRDMEAFIATVHPGVCKSAWNAPSAGAALSVISKMYSWIIPPSGSAGSSSSRSGCTNGSSNG